MEGDPPPEEDFSQIPLIERGAHKNWKARLSAYNDVIAASAKTASDSDPFFRPYLSDPALLKKWCLDANAIAQEKGVEATLAIVTDSGETSAKLRPEIVPALVEKVLGSMRAGTKRKGTDLCAMFVEVENGGEGVVTDVMAGLNAKAPKAVAGAVSTLKELVESFGVQALGNVKPLLKALPKIFGHSDKNVRAEGTSLTLALYTFLGPGLKPALADLKPVQVSDLEKAFEGLDGEGKGAGTGKPSRYTRKMQREREIAEAAGDDPEDEAPEEAAIDPMSLLDPVHVLDLFPDDVMERLASTKWKDRLEACEECNKVLAEPRNARIADANADAYGPLVQLLGAKCHKDANVNVVMEAAKLLEGLARGLKKSFGRYKGVTVTGLLERLKERKAAVVEALGKALDAIFLTTTLPDVTEEILTALKSKNPQVKQGTLDFLHRSLKVTTEPPAKDHIKPMAEQLVALLSDSAEPVRTAAAECLGTMMKILGERAFNPYIENVPEIQLAKVKDAFGRAEIKYRPGGVKKPAAKPVVKAAPKAAPMKKATPPPASPPRPAAKTNGGDEELLQDFAAPPPKKKPPARLLARMKAAAPASEESPPSSPGKPPPSPPPKAAPVRKVAPPAAKPAPKAAPPPAAVGPSKPAAKGAAKALASSPSEPIKYRYTPEDAAARAADLVPANFHTALADGAWKVRLEGADEMVAWVNDGGAELADSEIMMRFLGKMPGWGEKNFQKSPSFGKPASALVIPALTEKLGDLKLKKPAGDALGVIAEKTSLAFVLAQSYEPLGKQKAPKAQADALTWIKQQVIDFGIGGIPMRELISFIKTALGHANALVRSSATQLLVQVKIGVGADISGFLEDLNPTLLGTINKEFDKVASQAAPEPTREQADLREAAAGPGKSGKGGADPLDDLIPRVDLDKLVNQTTVLADSKSDAWKVRKEAFEALAALLDVKSNQRLKPNMGEIGTALKRAMTDTNLSVKMLALGITSKIATGIGAPFDKYCRLLVQSVAMVCADQKAMTRTVAVATLSAMADAIGSLDPMYAGLAASLESTNPALRAAVLGWIAERLTAEAPGRGADLACLAAPVISCLEDRNGEVRKAAGIVLPFVVANAGFDFVMDRTSGLKPASRSTILPLIQNARAAGDSTKAAPEPPAAPKAAPIRTAPARTPAKAAPARNASTPARPGSGIGRPGLAAPGRSIAMKALGSGPSTRPGSAMSDASGGGFGLKRTAIARALPPTAAPPPQQEDTGRTIPFTSSDANVRAHRLKRDATRWSLEPGNRADTLDYLHQQMEPVTSSDICHLMFSKDHRAEEDFMTALAVIAEFFDSETSDSFELHEDDLHAIQTANVDLALKYAAIRLLSNNTQLSARCLEVLSNVLDNLTSDGARLSETEVRLFVPALVMKLGDPKFGPRLAPIFEGLDKLIPASLVVQMLVQYGLEDKAAGKTGKNESLSLIEKAYRKRGSVLRYDNRGFYEAVARCIQDQGTRQAALTLMGLLQLQGESRNLQSVVDSLPISAKDMLANRRATLAAVKANSTGMARVTSDAGASSRSASPVPTAKSKIPGHGSPASRLSRDMTPQRSGTASPIGGRPASRGIPTTSRLAQPSSVRSIQPPSGMQPPSGLVRPGSQARRTAPNAEEEPRRPAAAARPSMMPLGRAPAPALSACAEIIEAIRAEDIEDAAEALKAASAMLEEDDQSFVTEARQLLDMLCWQLDQLGTDVVSLLEQRNLRRVKHLMRTIHLTFGRANIVKRLKLDQLDKLFGGIRRHYAILEVWVEQEGDGIQAANDLRDYMSMVLSAIIATPPRDVVYTMLFDSLVALCKDQRPGNTDKHAASEIGVILQCTYKRVRSVDNDLRSSCIQAGTLLAIIENLLQVIPPVQWRRRPKQGLPHGDLPLRVIKTLLQRVIVYTKEINVGIYDLLQEQFGAEADTTTVYSYIFRISSADDGSAPGPPATSPAIEAPLPRRRSNGTSERPMSVSSSGTRSSMGPDILAPPIQKSPSRDVSEAERLVRRLTDPRDSEQRLNELHAFMKASDSNETEARAAISAILNPAAQTFVWRALDRRSEAAEPRSPPPTSPVKGVRDLPSPPLSGLPAGLGSRRISGISGPSSGTSSATSSTTSAMVRPASMIDRTAPVDDQLAQLKAVFGRATSRHSGGTPTKSPTRPMSEIEPGTPRPSLPRPMSEFQPRGEM
ncbi:hypothetical protein CspHIS471_0502170 [Cutaneotrichosporon sp. HIS471]|nr:hypothetical protein CspHIS471_0502170 [Cutaneotrichosporon sp. HIS471]